jgi:hypothetical protein
MVWVHFQLNDYHKIWFIIPTLAERNFLSCNLIILSWLLLGLATNDLSVCAGRICLLCSLILIWIDRLFVQYKPFRIHMGCCINRAFLITKHPSQLEGGCRFA